MFPDSLKLKVMGGTKSQVSKQMADHLNNNLLLPRDLPLVSPEEWAAHTTPLESYHFSLGCPLMPGIIELVSIVKERGLLAAVATSSARNTFDLKSRQHSHLFSMFDSITCGDDPDYAVDIPDGLDRPLVKGKPHPSIFLTARYHLNRQSSFNGIVLEDSPNGVVAALRSGHSCIWIPSVRGADFGLIDAGLGGEGNEIRDGLWVYRADSLYEVIEALNMSS